jgi:transcriptional regulator with XRE-family HTH domain
MENNSFNKFRLRDLRRENNLTSRNLAKLLNVSQPTITRWENGLQEPSKKNVKKLASYFNVSSDYLLGLTDEREPYKKPMKFEEALKILENTKRNDDIFTITDNIKNLSDEQLHTIATIVESFTKK